MFKPYQNCLTLWEKLYFKKIKFTQDLVLFHDSFSLYFSLSAYSRAPPSIHVEIPSFKTVMMAASEVKATCLVHTVFDAKVIWLMDGRLTPSNKVKQAANTTHIISDVTVSSSQWKQLKFITCKAEHKCFSSTERTVNVAGKMIIQHESQTSCDSKGPKRIHCDFFPVVILQRLHLQLHQWGSGDLSQICWRGTVLCWSVTSHNSPPVTSTSPFRPTGLIFLTNSMLIFLKPQASIQSVDASLSPQVTGRTTQVSPAKWIKASPATLSQTPQAIYLVRGVTLLSPWCFTLY